MKYLCIDTNIYIQCCLLELEGDDIKAIQDLRGLLDDDKVVLLLPEVIELEFHKVLTQKSEELKEMVGVHKAAINKDNAFDKKIKTDMLKKLDEVIAEREKNTARVLELIDEIFSHKNTRKIPLNVNVLLSSYKFFLEGKRPYVLGKSEAIDSDSIIIQLLNEFLVKEKDYEFYFCSNNTSEFAVDGKKELTNHHLEIHPEIKKHFSNIEYYVDLLNLLKEQFNKNYTDEEIEKIKEISVAKGTDLNDFSTSISSSEMASPSPSEMILNDSLNEAGVSEESEKGREG